MAVLRQFNFLGQERIDIPHLRAIESAICGDFDLMVGMAMCGKKSYIVDGFKVSIPGAVGSPASSLQVVTAGGILLHYNATESGTIFFTPADRAVEKLAATNARVSGSFTASAINYVGIDIRRAADDSTADTAQFLDADTLRETPKTVPLGRTLDYLFIISTTDFSTTPAVAAVARVTTDAANNVVSVEDARERLFRLGRGGSVPTNTYAYPWPEGRLENSSGEVFNGGDKPIACLKDWLDALMTRVWELGGGERWYSGVADRNVKMVRTGATFANGEYFEWDGTHLHWKGLKLVFPNSTGWYNDITNQTADSSGLTNLADGECIYVDIDYSSNRTAGTALLAQKGVTRTLGNPTIPGGRFIIAWRVGTAIFGRDQAWPVGSHFTPATTTSLGVVKLGSAAVDAAEPCVTTFETVNQRAFAKGMIRASAWGDGGVDLVATYAQGTGGSAMSVLSGSTVVASVDSAGKIAAETFDIRRDAHRRPSITHSSGGWTAVTQTGAGTGTVVPSGPCAWPYKFVVKVTTAGAVGTAFIAFSIDGGVTYEAPVVTAATVTHAGTGVIVSLANTFVLGDLYSFQSYFGSLATFAADDGKVKTVIDHCGFPGGRRSEIREEWMVDWLNLTASPSPNPWMWNIATTDGTVSTAIGSVVGIRGRVCVLSMTDGSMNDLASTTSTPFTWHNATTTAGMVMETEAEVHVEGTAATITKAVSLFGLVASATGITPGGYYFKSTAGGNWFAVVRDSGAGTETAVDTGKNVGTRNDRGVARLRLEYRLMGATTTILFFIDETLVAATTTNIKADQNWRLHAGVKNDGSGAGGGLVDLYVGPILCQWNRFDAAPQF